MIILGIETSCDETAASVIEGKGNNIRVLSNVVSSQIEIHKKYGGVIPEVAAREHVLNILPVVNEALEKAKIKSPLSPLTKGGNLDAIAITVGPGLVTSLIVGVETARSLAYAWNLPVVAVNHIEGHIYANWISEEFPLAPFNKGGKKNTPLTKGGEGGIKFPALILTVSGGHNLLVLMKGHGKYKIIGETLDDAAGEAFDKAAAMLGIGYPGGPAIAAEAARFQISDFRFQNNSAIKNQKSKIILPRPMLNKPGYDFSFSGLKTALLYQIKKDSNWKKRIPEYANEFEQAVVDVLVSKTIKAAKEFKVKTVMLSGGVSANRALRESMERMVKEKLEDVEFRMPELKYTTDNAAMIAAAGYFRAREKKYISWQKLKVNPNLELK